MKEPVVRVEVDRGYACTLDMVMDKVSRRTEKILAKFILTGETQVALHSNA